ncbi:hypothetical protein ACQKH5_05580 [Hyphomonas sp. NPDC076900]|uniref:hypothetical protein n=1 Tax=unclassified Hyphomonas TaxID=2630699 RepID=UPI003D043F65
MSKDIAMLVSRLGTFRPSDRATLNRSFGDPASRDVAIDAVKQFVLRWENANWLEVYSIERIGKWIAKYRPEMVDTFKEWSASDPSDAKIALASGMEQGCVEASVH